MQHQSLHTQHQLGPYSTPTKQHPTLTHTNVPHPLATLNGTQSHVTNVTSMATRVINVAYMDTQWLGVMFLFFPNNITFKNAHKTLDYVFPNFVYSKCFTTYPQDCDCLCRNPCQLPLTCSSTLASATSTNPAHLTHMHGQLPIPRTTKLIVC